MISEREKECDWCDETKPTADKWTVTEVLKWAEKFCPRNALSLLERQNIDGEVLLAITEEDIRLLCKDYCFNLTFVDKKKFWLAIQALQQSSAAHLRFGVSRITQQHQVYGNQFIGSAIPPESVSYQIRCNDECDVSPPTSVNGCATNIPTEFFKTAISLGYSFLVTWITSFVMVIVHERVPDMKRYPPLPDIFLDNVPHIPWAFHMCEITGTLLFTIWSCVCIFHKYRMVLLRRFFALAGTVFLLRCVTMLITSLSVPGTHLQCNQNDYAIDDTGLSVSEALALRISRAYIIWSGLGMSIQGVRTCGDYMFSGHTVALTLLNFFITEYTPRNLYFLHTLSWLLNMFGIFFILAAHEHYSIDVFVAFYITSRLFLYYHTLANNRALMSNDSNRTRIWFPMFSYFESCVDGIIPNEFDSVGTLMENFLELILGLKNSCMNIASLIWIKNPKTTNTTNNFLFIPKVTSTEQRNVATSTNASECNTPTTKSSLTHFNKIEPNVAARDKID